MTDSLLRPFDIGPGGLKSGTYLYLLIKAFVYKLNTYWIKLTLKLTLKAIVSGQHFHTLLGHELP